MGPFGQKSISERKHVAWRATCKLNKEVLQTFGFIVDDLTESFQVLYAVLWTKQVCNEAFFKADF